MYSPRYTIKGACDLTIIQMINDKMRTLLSVTFSKLNNTQFHISGIKNYP